MQQLPDNQSLRPSDGNVNMSQTYVQITHHHMEKLSQTKPKFIGVNFVPFPNSSIYPETSLLQADDIPRCTYCSAFFNKFNKYNSREFCCSLCGKRNKFKTPNIYNDNNLPGSNVYIPSFNGGTNFGGVDPKEIPGSNSPECRHEVYDAIAKTKFKYRSQTFIPTSYFYISLSLMKTNPEIFTYIDQYLQQCYKVRQIGICFLHGAMTLVKQRPFLEFQTYFDDAPECRSPMYYVSSYYFRTNFQKIINKAIELNYVEAAYEDDYCKNVIEHSKKMSLMFGTNVYFIFDERDFNLFSAEKNSNLIISCALEMLKGNVQASVSVFASQNRIGNLENQNPLLNFSAITGGIFKIFPQSILNFGDPNQSVNDMYNEFLNMLNCPSINDTFIFVCPPENAPLIDFAGQGMMKSHTGITISKIKLNDSFSFTFDPSDCDGSPYIQLVTYFTTQDDIRRMRVVTVPIFSYQSINLTAQLNCVLTFVAQRLLVEGKEKAKKTLDSFKKAFKEINYSIPDFIVNNTNFLQAAQYSLSAFNKFVYGAGSLNQTVQYESQQYAQNVQQFYQQQQQLAQPQQYYQQQQQFGQQVLLQQQQQQYYQQQQFQQPQQQFDQQVLLQQQQQYQQPIQQYDQQQFGQQVLHQQQQQQYYQQQQQYQQPIQQYSQQLQQYQTDQPVQQPQQQNNLQQYQEQNQEQQQVQNQLKPQNNYSTA